MMLVGGLDAIFGLVVGALVVTAMERTTWHSSAPG